MSLVKHQGNMVKVLVAWQNVEPKWYICTVDAGRYLCKEVTQVSLTARHRRVRTSVSQALKVCCMPWLGLDMGNTVGYPITLPTVNGGSRQNMAFSKRQVGSVTPMGDLTPLPITLLSCLLLGHWHEPNTHLS